jgi:PsbP
MKFTSTFIFLLISTFCFSQSDSTKLNFSTGEFQFQYAKTWSIDTSKKMGTVFFVFSPLENKADNFRENVNGIIQDLSGQNISLEKYKQITDKQLSEMGKACKVFESSIIKTNNKEYLKVTYSLQQGDFKLKISSICIIKNDNAYLVTFSSAFDKYEQYKKDGEGILNSFNLTN